MTSLYIVFAISALVTAAMTPLVIWGARRRGFVSLPTADRWHQKPTALMGGIAIFLGCTIGVAAMVGLITTGYLDLPERRFATSLIGIVGSAAIMFCVGIADDIWKFRPATKLVLQIVAGAVLIATGTLYPLTPWVTLNTLFTLFWFLGVTNALNLLDNMDGVAVGVSSIAALFLGITFILQEQPLLAAICIALSGACAGFLPYNFHRASIFMGDSGSLFIGALLAGLGAAFPRTASGSLISVLFVPALIVIIPILDTALVSLTRTLAGRSVAVGGRDHTSHRLVAMGLSERQVALALYAFAALGGLIAMLGQWVLVPITTPLAFGFLLVLTVIAAYLTRLHSYEKVEDVPNAATVLISNLLHKRRAAEFLIDVVIFALSYHAAYLLRWDGAIPPDQLALLRDTLPLAIVAKAVSFGVTGVYRGVWRRVSVTDVHRISQAAILGSVLTFAGCAFIYPRGMFPRSAFVIDAILVVGLTSGVRLSFRSLEHFRHRLATHGRPVAIFGAGAAGELVCRELRGNSGSDFRPVCFIDDDVRKVGRHLQGVQVVGGLDALPDAILKYGVSAIVIAISDIPLPVLQKLEAIGHQLHLDVYRLNLEFTPVSGRHAKEHPLAV
jgi:UDP-GlcNAc:undecaprenyl-phosphate/decaprenyl-phosphate GlcNAc-1-phosphate transferase